MAETDTASSSNASSGGSEATRIENGENPDVWYKGVAEPLTTGPIHAKATHDGYRVKTAAKDDHPYYYLHHEGYVAAMGMVNMIGGYILARLPFGFKLFHWASTGLYTWGSICLLTALTYVYQRYNQPHPHAGDVPRNRHAGDPGGDEMLRTGFPKEKDRQTGKEIVEAPLHNFPMLELIYAPHRIKVIDKFFEKVAWALSYAIPVIAIVMRHLYWERWYSRYAIKSFCQRFDIELDDFHVPEGGFKTFQDFFTRQVKKERRPIESIDDDTVLTAPADCRILVYENVADLVEMSFKGVHFDLPKLVGPQLAERYGDPSKMSMILARPGIEDYHHFHVPCRGRIKSLHTFDYRMQAIAGEGNLEGHTELPYSHRCVLEFENTPHIGNWVYVPIGASIVNSIEFVRKVGDELKKGDELGYFRYGSNVIFLFPRGSVKFDDDILRNSDQHTESRIILGTKIGRIIPKDQRKQ